MKNVVILYSTTDGQTLKISRRIQSILQNNGHEVKLCPIGSIDRKALDRSDKVIIGAGIRYGRHRKEVFDFIENNQDILESKFSAFFTVNLVARKPGKSSPGANPYLKRFLAKISWKPDELAVFAGKIDYPKYSVIDRQIIRFIMLLTKGPTDPNSVIEFTDWEQVEQFGKVVSAAGLPEQ